MKLPSNNGFTLLEVLLAVAILGVVVAMTSIGLNSTVKLVEMTSSQQGIYRQVKVTFERITEDITSALADQGGLFVGQESEIGGRAADNLTFLSRAHLSLATESEAGGTAVIRYRVIVDEAENKYLKLLRFDTLNRPGGAVSNEPGFILCENIYSFQLKYFDVDGQEFDSWDAGIGDESDTGKRIVLPAVVSITIEFKIDDNTILPFQTSVWLPVGIIHHEKIDA